MNFKIDVFWKGHICNWKKYHMFQYFFKGQLIFWCHLDQKTNEIILRISALASKERLNQKLYDNKYVE